MVRGDGRIDIEVVLVCDAVSSNDDESFAYSADGDRPTENSLALIRSGLTGAATRVAHYRDLQALIDNLSKHREAVIFPYWFGRLSRNRHSLVPAICEAYDLCYVGADTYTKTVCNDKFLSKSLCEIAGLTTASSFLMACEQDLRYLEHCSYPRVIKPNSQGSSLGIEDNNLVRSPEAAREVTKRIAQFFGWPVLCEEFIQGREVSISIMGNHRDPPAIGMLSWTMNEDPGFLDNRLFSYALKYVAGIKFSPLILDNQLEPMRPACERLFKMLDKVEIMRIDGRLTSKGFVVIELSPDLDLRPDGEAAISFADKEGSYPLFLRRLIINSLERAGRQTPVDDKG